MLGGGAAAAGAMEAARPRELLRAGLGALAQHARVAERPSWASLTLARGGIPQYTMGHDARAEAAREAAARALGPRFRLIGNSWRGIGLADSLATAGAAGREVAAQLEAGSWRGE